MLHAADMKYKFWGEAIMTATYIRNRTATKIVEGMTLHLKLGTKENRKLDISEFLVVKHMFTYQKKSDKKWMQRLLNAFWLDIQKKPKGTDYWIQKHTKSL